MASEPLIAKAEWSEANDLLSLLRAGESSDATRKLIGNSSPERRRLLLAFDSLSISPGRKAIITDELRGEVARLLKEGLAATRIATELKLSLRIIRRAAPPGLLKPKGRGRRFAKQFQAAIILAIKNGMPPSEIEKRFNVSHSHVWHVRRKIEGKQFRDRRRDRRFTEQEAAQIRARHAAGETRKSIARSLGCGATTIFHVLNHEHGY